MNNAHQPMRSMCKTFNDFKTWLNSNANESIFYKIYRALDKFPACLFWHFSPENSSDAWCTRESAILVTCKHFTGSSEIYGLYHLLGASKHYLYGYICSLELPLLGPFDHHKSALFQLKSVRVFSVPYGQAGRLSINERIFWCVEPKLYLITIWYSIRPRPTDE